MYLKRLFVASLLGILLISSCSGKMSIQATSPSIKPSSTSSSQIELPPTPIIPTLTATATPPPTDFIIDQANAVEQPLQAGEAMEVTFPVEDNGFFDVTIPPNALVQAETLSMASILPASQTEGNFEHGFSITNSADPTSSLELLEPAEVVYAYAGTLPPNARLVYYDQNAHGYVAMPTDRSDEEGKTILTTETDHFTVFRVDTGGTIVSANPVSPFSKLLKNSSFYIAVDGKLPVTGWMTGINGGTQNLTGTLSFHFLVTKKGGTIYGNYSGKSEIVVAINGAEAAMDLINNNISIKIPVYSPPTPHNGSKPQVSILSTSRGTHISPNDLSLDYIGGVNISFQISYTLGGTSISVPLQVTLVKEANETYVVITLTNPSNQELKFDGDWAYKSGP